MLMPTSSLPDALAEVGKLNGHRPLSLDGVNIQSAALRSFAADNPIASVV